MLQLTHWWSHSYIQLSKAKKNSSNFQQQQHLLVLQGRSNDNEDITMIPTNKQSHRHLLSSCLLAVSILFGASLSTNALDTTFESRGALPSGSRYWDIMTHSTLYSDADRVKANEALMDYAVGTVNTMYYDNSGGAYFTPREFYNRWRAFRTIARGEDVDGAKLVYTSRSKYEMDSTSIPRDINLDTRNGVEKGLKWLVSSLNDPFSKYLTREELLRELQESNDGFVGLGAIVEPARSLSKSQILSTIPKASANTASSTTTSTATSISKKSSKNVMLSTTRVDNLPVITAIAPDSPAERGGLAVGDRIVSVGSLNFLGWSRSDIDKAMQTKLSADNYLGTVDITVAKPVFYASINNIDGDKNNNNNFNNFGMIGAADIKQRQVSNIVGGGDDVLAGYRQIRAKLPTQASLESPLFATKTMEKDGVVAGGDNIVHYELLSADNSIFNPAPQHHHKVGYIRLTRFSKAATAGYLQAIEALEKAGAESYILDLRNNYGGVIQEAMLTASTLLRDSHSILCFTLNARGGFTPHDVEEFVVDARYPGYLLSSEPKTVTLDQVRLQSPEMFEANGIKWVPPSSFASLHEQATKRGIKLASSVSNDLIEPRDKLLWQLSQPSKRDQLLAQKNIVLLINEGTASAAEVFASSLHDNGRTVAMVGTKTYGKGLIQHTFPMPDGGGLRLTVAEYLTPTLHHVTNVGLAKFDRYTGAFVGGGIKPDIYCGSKQGIPSKITGDFCVGMALDALEEAETVQDELGLSPIITSSNNIVASIEPTNNDSKNK